MASGGTIALLGWCAYFIPIGVLAYRHFQRNLNLDMKDVVGYCKNLILPFQNCVFLNLTV